MTPGEPLSTVLQLPGSFISLGSMLCTSRAASAPALELICSWHWMIMHHSAQCSEFPEYFAGLISCKASSLEYMGDWAAAFPSSSPRSSNVEQILPGCVPQLAACPWVYLAAGLLCSQPEARAQFRGFLFVLHPRWHSQSEQSQGFSLIMVYFFKNCRLLFKFTKLTCHSSMVHPVTAAKLAWI